MSVSRKNLIKSRVSFLNSVKSNFSRLSILPNIKNVSLADIRRSMAIRGHDYNFSASEIEIIRQIWEGNGWAYNRDKNPYFSKKNSINN